MTMLWPRLTSNIRQKWDFWAGLGASFLISVWTVSRFPGLGYVGSVGCDCWWYFGLSISPELILNQRPISYQQSRVGAWIPLFLAEKLMKPENLETFLPAILTAVSFVLVYGIAAELNKDSGRGRELRPWVAVFAVSVSISLWSLSTTGNSDTALKIPATLLAGYVLTRSWHLTPTSSRRRVYVHGVFAGFSLFLAYAVSAHLVPYLLLIHAFVMVGRLAQSAEKSSALFQLIRHIVSGLVGVSLGSVAYIAGLMAFGVDASKGLRLLWSQVEFISNRAAGFGETSGSFLSFLERLPQSGSLLIAIAGLAVSAILLVMYKKQVVLDHSFRRNYVVILAVIVANMSSLAAFATVMPKLAEDKHSLQWMFGVVLAGGVLIGAVRESQFSKGARWFFGLLLAGSSAQLLTLALREPVRIGEWFQFLHLAGGLSVSFSILVAFFLRRRDANLWAKRLIAASLFFVLVISLGGRGNYYMRTPFQDWENLRENSRVARDTLVFLGKDPAAPFSFYYAEAVNLNAGTPLGATYRSLSFCRWPARYAAPSVVFFPAYSPGGEVRLISSDDAATVREIEALVPELETEKYFHGIRVWSETD